MTERLNWTELYECESWTIKQSECRRIDSFELWCWKRLFRVPWTARISNQPILKEISPEYSLEGLMLKLKLQYYLATWWKELIPWKRPWCWERLKEGGEGDNRGWDSWMASWTKWTLVWAKLEIAKDSETWRATVYGVKKSKTGLEWMITTCPILTFPDNKEYQKEKKY